MKVILYILTTSGVDGRAPTSIEYAFDTEAQREAKLKALGTNAAWYSKEEKIVDLVSGTKQAFAKLDGVDMYLIVKKLFGLKIGETFVARIDKRRSA